MKKLSVFLFVIVICIWGYDLFQSEINFPPSTNSSTSINEGDLILINSSYAMHENAIPTDIIQAEQHINYASIDDSSIELSKRLVQPLNAMLKEAREQGITNFAINSGYRTFETQQSLYDELGANIALPAGHSEHQLGLAIDIGSTNGPMGLSEEGMWLAQNSWRYGFILRYPEGKTDITGISFEPWHFRYVGIPHSQILFDEQWVLEEYLAYLKENGSYETKSHKIIYVSSIDQAKQVANNSPYTISGDNLAGYIVTVKKQ
ncbi:MAG: M15 family metallopeptidase [Solibacillus sp.]|uniref:M15 family metallopeptidase n=1 Tax=Solibacillus sp. TaxID=1909654 RepID=UPI0033164AA7